MLEPSHIDLTRARALFAHWSAVLSWNLAALTTELRKTGELGQLLAKAAAGTALDNRERAKVKAQLIDVAKAVPALALFAAPGGMLLLPLLAKVLPWNVLPSAWDRAPTMRALPPFIAPPPPSARRVDRAPPRPPAQLSP